MPPVLTVLGSEGHFSLSHPISALHQLCPADLGVLIVFPLAILAFLVACGYHKIGADSLRAKQKRLTSSFNWSIGFDSEGMGNVDWSLDGADKA